VIELVVAVKHVFECLFQLHRLGYVHYDIRWNNIIEVFGDWFVIIPILLHSVYCCCPKRYTVVTAKKI